MSTPGITIVPGSFSAPPEMGQYGRRDMFWPKVPTGAPKKIPMQWHTLPQYDEEGEASDPLESSNYYYVLGRNSANLITPRDGYYWHTYADVIGKITNSRYAIEVQQPGVFNGTNFVQDCAKTFFPSVTEIELGDIEVALGQTIHMPLDYSIALDAVGDGAAYSVVAYQDGVIGASGQTGTMTTTSEPSTFIPGVYTESLAAGFLLLRDGQPYDQVDVFIRFRLRCVIVPSSGDIVLPAQNFSDTLWGGGIPTSIPRGTIPGLPYEEYIRTSWAPGATAIIS